MIQQYWQAVYEAEFLEAEKLRLEEEDKFV